VIMLVLYSMNSSLCCAVRLTALTVPPRGLQNSFPCLIKRKMFQMDNKVTSTEAYLVYNIHINPEPSTLNPSSTAWPSKTGASSAPPSSALPLISLPPPPPPSNAPPPPPAAPMQSRRIRHAGTVRWRGGAAGAPSTTGGGARIRRRRAARGKGGGQILPVNQILPVFAGRGGGCSSTPRATRRRPVSRRLGAHPTKKGRLTLNSKPETQGPKP